MISNCWGTWLIMLGFMDLGSPRRLSAFNVGLVQISHIQILPVMIYVLHDKKQITCQAKFTLFVSWISLTHWGRLKHICVGNLTIIGSDNGLSPGWRQAITWTNVGILLITPSNKLQWNVNRNSYIFIQENPFEYDIWKMGAILSRPQCVNMFPVLVLEASIGKNISKWSVWRSVTPFSLPY